MSQANRKRGEQRVGTCVYCGTTGPITDDHVIPRTLFIVKDEQMVTVPACHRCQAVKELGDRDLWIFVTLDMGGSQHPDMMTHLRRIFDRNEQTRRWLTKSFSEAVEVPLVTKGGLIVGTTLAFPYNTDRMIRTVGMMVRGLYYEETKKILPPETPIHVLHVPWQHTSGALQGFGSIRQGEPTVKGNNVVFWKSYFPVDSEPDSTGWILCFNDWVTFLGTSGSLAVSGQRMNAETEARSAIRELSQRFLLLPKRPWAGVLESDAEGVPILPPGASTVPSRLGQIVLPERHTDLSFLYRPKERHLTQQLTQLASSRSLPLNPKLLEESRESRFWQFDLPLQHRNWSSG